MGRCDQRAERTAISTQRRRTSARTAGYLQARCACGAGQRLFCILFVCKAKGTAAPAAATVALSHAASLRHPARVRDLLEPPLALGR